MIDLIAYALVTLLCLFFATLFWARGVAERAADDIAGSINDA